MNIDYNLLCFVLSITGLWTPIILLFIARNMEDDMKKQGLHVRKLRTIRRCRIAAAAIWLFIFFPAVLKLLFNLK